MPAPPAGAEIVPAGAPGKGISKHPGERGPAFLSDAFTRGHLTMYDYIIDYQEKLVALATSQTPFMDWDTNDSAKHPSQCVTFSTKADCLNFVERKAKRWGLLLSLYKTKGGIHGIVLNKQLAAVRCRRLFQPFKVDDVYQIFTTGKQLYKLRVSPKVGRPEAKPLYIGEVGIGTAFEENLAIKEVHDSLIEQHF